MTWFRCIGVAILVWLLWTNGRSTFRGMRSNGQGSIGPKTLLSIIIAILMVAVFVYGLFQYSDGPIRPCAGPFGFCGKQGQPHNFLEYRRFVTWETVLIILWPLGLLFLFLLNRKRPKLDTGGTP